jgi:hypothetical protein
MNKSILAKSNSYGKLALFFPDHATVWDDFPVLKEEVNSFFSLKSQFERASKTQSSDTTGLTDAKNAKLELAKNLCLKLCLKAVTWARKGNMYEALATLDIGEADFRVAQSTQILMAKNVVTVLRKNLVALEAYRIREADVQALESAINLADENIASPALAKNEKGLASSSLDELVLLIDEVVLNINNLIVAEYEESHGEIVDRFLLAKRVDKLPVRHTVLRGKVSHAGTHEPLQGAFCNLLEIDGEEVFSDLNGFYEIKEFKAGTMTFEVRLEGYEPFSQVLNIKLAQVLELNVALKPLG